jgi:maltose-binding protein MalE
LKKKLEHLLRYYWYVYLIAAVLAAVFALLVFEYTQPPIPANKQLKVKIATDFILSSEFMDWHTELEKEMNLTKVSLDYTQINRATPNNFTWEYFNVNIYTADSDVFLVPANKVKELAAMGVLLPLDEYVKAERFKVEADDEYTYENKQGERQLFALPIASSKIMKERFYLDIEGEGYSPANDSEMVFCIPTFSKNIDGAIAWMNLICPGQ